MEKGVHSASGHQSVGSGFKHLQSKHPQLSYQGLPVFVESPSQICSRQKVEAEGQIKSR